jgi:membrane-associated phospholipid phosphatase
LNKRLLVFYAFIAGTIIGLLFFVHYYPTSFFDIHVTHEIQELNMGHFTSVMEFISIFGNPIVVLLSVIFASLFFFVTHNRREFCFIFSTLIPDLLTNLIKIMVNRPRPTWQNAKLLLKFNQSSFPSGHVVHYVVFFGFLLAVMFVNKKIPSFWRISIGIFSAFLISTISISRIYLGAHWATDVIGGYLFGFAYLGIILKFYLKGNFFLKTVPLESRVSLRQKE